MKKQISDITVVGFALFAMFFGAGNIIFPPYIGLVGGAEWMTGYFCFWFADIGLAILTLFAMLSSDGIETPQNLLHRLGKTPATVLMAIIMLTVGLLCMPRTGTTSYEMAVAPLTGRSPLSLGVTSVVYFAVVLLCSLKLSAVVDLIGKYMTPLLVFGLVVLIVAGVMDPLGPLNDTVRIDNLIWTGISSGYQTMDVFASIIFGLILLEALKSRGYTAPREKYATMAACGLLAGFLLLIIYGGLCYLGATVSSVYPANTNIAELVINITNGIFGRAGTYLLGLIVILACLTTAVGQVSVISHFFTTISGGRLPYKALVVAGCAGSALVANIGLTAIIQVAAPILGIVYPGVLAVACLCLFNKHIKNDNVFKMAAVGAMAASLLDVAYGLGMPLGFVPGMPLQAYGFSWVLPAAACAAIGWFIRPGGVRVEAASPSA